MSILLGILASKQREIGFLTLSMCALYLLLLLW